MTEQISFKDCFVKTIKELDDDKKLRVFNTICDAETNQNGENEYNFKPIGEVARKVLLKLIIGVNND